MRLQKLSPHPCLHQKHHRRSFRQSLQTQHPHQEHLLQLLVQTPRAQPEVEHGMCKEQHN
jgi:hypothetical protein